MEPGRNSVLSATPGFFLDIGVSVSLAKRTFPSFTIEITAPAIFSARNCCGMMPSRNAETSCGVSSCVPDVGGFNRRWSLRFRSQRVHLGLLPDNDKVMKRTTTLTRENDSERTAAETEMTRHPPGYRLQLEIKRFQSEHFARESLLSRVPVRYVRETWLVLPPGMFPATRPASLLRHW